MGIVCDFVGDEHLRGNALAQESAVKPVRGTRRAAGYVRRADVDDFHD